MDEQMGWRGMLRNIKEEAPSWAGTLPQLPRLVHQALAEPNRQQAAQREELERLRTGQQRQGRMLIVIGLLLATLVGLEAYRLLG